MSCILAERKPEKKTQTKLKTLQKEPKPRILKYEN